MTTPQSPDGQQPQTPNSGAVNPGAPGEELIRNMDDLRKLVGQREDLKTEVRELRALVEGVVGKLDKLGTPHASEGQQAPATPPNPLAAELAELKTAVQSIVGDKTNEQKSARRKAITDAVVSVAKEDQRELVRGALSTLVLDGAVDIHAENTTAEAEKALTRLRAAHPAAFAPASSSSGASDGQHDLIPPGVPLHELTREQLARMTDEDFSKARKAARTSRLAV